MKLGKNWGFWLNIILIIIRSLAAEFAKGKDNPGEVGPGLARGLLDYATKQNEDDDLGGIPPDAVL